MALDVFTEFFGPTLPMEDAGVIRNSKRVPREASFIYDKEGRIIQMRRINGVLVRKVVVEASKPMKLPSSWSLPSSPVK